VALSRWLGIRVAEMVGHDGIEPSTSVWKTGVAFQYLNPKEGNLIFDINLLPAPRNHLQMETMFSSILTFRPVKLAVLVRSYVAKTVGP
jgi:hypothetical protein